ncbi:hypothetical protein XM38_023730 [Halomicronema hongdechloris C2206]|uniref:DUF72 domain-containing protein n=1 Tax=Halomicronema hongdechloris C2206 TaxID=1641165 RepID=A0A1Z3HM80_9CYAN|nr:DUF72 domain-containing protein [Halomicronema hongdechloris]ASC71421.1 hypothetical protein XM38_023730 [Halomicronema hongdechloris C2206]
MATAIIGTSGFSYKHWRYPTFYPKGVPSGQWLAHYSQVFRTVELNSTFYRLPSTKMLTRWRTVTPPDFTFAVKVSRLITHARRLAACEELLLNFLQRVALLESKLGPLLLQLPPNFALDLPRLSQLLDILNSQSVVSAPKVVLEVRHASWLVPAMFDRLRQSNVALCWADGAQLTVAAPTTADFLYLRRHGPGGTMDQGYPLEQLQSESDRLCHWLSLGYDAYVYFNNDGGGYAVKNAQQLQQHLTPLTRP